MGAWDEPPPSPRGIFGCLGFAAGLGFLVTGGLCAFASFSAGRSTAIAGLIGVGVAFLGLVMMRRR